MMPVGEISQRLADRVLDVCRMLLPGGKEVLGEWVCGDTNGNAGKSLKVNLNGGHPGKWRDWAAGDDERGDLLDLWRIVRSLSPGDAIQQAKEFLGISEPKPAQKKTYAKAPEKAYKQPHPEGQVLKWFAEKRKITAETVKAFKVTLREDPDGTRWIVFPSYGPTGEIINRSYRSFPKTKDEKKEVRQDKGCAPSLFGWHCLTPEAWEMKTVILCEGQIDAMSWFQWGMPVLSIPNGTGTTWLDYEWENLQMFERIYLAFDMDEQGREIRRKAIQRLGAHRCHIVEMPHKDANECLKQGMTTKEAQRLISLARMPEFEGIVVGSELIDRLRADMSVKEKPFTLKMFDHDWTYQKGLYFRRGEVTVWTGNSGNGKSTLMNWIQLCGVCQEKSVYVCSLEVKAENTAKKIAHASLCSDGEPRTMDNYELWLKLLGHRIVLCDVVGFIKQEVLFQQMHFAFQRYGVSQIFIDSLMRIEGLTENYSGQLDFLNKLQEFAKATGTHVHLVCHPSKIKDRKVGMFDVKGAGDIVNNADNVVVVTRNPEKSAIEKERELTDDEHKMHDTEVLVEKQREGGWTGTFYLKFNRFDYTFLPTDKYSPPKPDTRKRKPTWQDTRY